MSMASAHETVGPPRTEIGLLGWLKKNLFSTWYNTLLTIGSFLLVSVILYGVISWSLTSARWGVITTNWRVLLIGRYTSEDPSAIWRIWFTLGVVAGMTVLTWVVWARGIQRVRPWILLGWVLSFPVILAVLWGVSPTLWSGLMLTLLLAIIGIVASFPLGILLALGRRSNIRGVLLIPTFAAVAAWLLLPVLFSGLRTATDLLPSITHPPNNLSPPVATFVSALAGFFEAAHSFFLVEIDLGPLGSFPWYWLVVPIILAVGILLERRRGFPGVNFIKLFSTLYIEIIRGVPLITILFMADLILPLFLPIELRIERVIRAMVGITLFTAAYSAEDVRGGLAAIPRGQYEAARAVGLNNPLTMVLIILPQALRAMIPSIVGQFISLFKDTTLVQIIGLLDLLGIAKAVTGQREWIGTQREIYLVCGIIFFVFCYAMSHASRRLETTLGVGKR
jgi:general L-amino acid transport system permease protein